MDDQKQLTPRPILATLLSGVLRGSPSLGAALGEFRQALANSSAGAAEVEQVDESLRLFGEASITFSDPQRALDWLTSPSDVFGGQTPLSQLHTSDGRLAVRSQLTRIEHGIFF